MGPSKYRSTKGASKGVGHYICRITFNPTANTVVVLLKAFQAMPGFQQVVLPVVDLCSTEALFPENKVTSNKSYQVGRTCRIV